MIGFVVAQLIVVTLHYRATRLNHETEEIKLARELYREFYLQEKSYLQIAGAIESCQKLYKNDRGNFGHVFINEYLRFFSDLGLLLIGHFFGAYIVEAYEYPEIKLYRAHAKELPPAGSVRRIRDRGQGDRERSALRTPCDARKGHLTNRKGILRHDVPHCDCLLPAVVPRRGKPGLSGARVRSRNGGRRRCDQ